MQTTLLVAMAIGLAAVGAFVLYRSRRRGRVIPDDLRPVIIEEALRRARSKQQAALRDVAVRHDRAS